MDEKEEYILFHQFVGACEAQWRIGGKRYAYGENKEWTDVVCEVVGNRWIGGNILKYAGEIDNYKLIGEPVPEVDFYKIAVYCYIWWLKEFKHPSTGIRLKEENWDEFVKGFSSAVTGIGVEGVIDRHAFVDLVKTQLTAPTMQTFYLIASLSYKWWLSERSVSTKEDEGDKF
jgi:hypothetical protein